MKFSKYNVFLHYNSHFLAYNAYADRYLILDTILYDMIQSAIVYGIGDLKDIHPDFFNALVENGFLISNEIDEIDEVRKLIRSVDANEDIYHLIVNPTMNCNFKCWYCYETHIKGSKMDGDTIDKISNHIGRYLVENEKSKDLNAFVFGGEPLLYFDNVVRPLLIKAKNISDMCNIQVESNFYFKWVF